MSVKEEDYDFECCYNCRFFRDGGYQPRDDEAMCVRYAPHPIVTSDDQSEIEIAKWAFVSALDWCGDYKEKRHLTKRAADGLRGWWAVKSYKISIWFAKISGAIRRR
jgi:hypothetical protein